MSTKKGFKKIINRVFGGYVIFVIIYTLISGVYMIVKYSNFEKTIATKDSFFYSYLNGEYVFDTNRLETHIDTNKEISEVEIIFNPKNPSEVVVVENISSMYYAGYNTYLGFVLGLMLCWGTFIICIGNKERRRYGMLAILLLFIVQVVWYYLLNPIIGEFISHVILSII